MGLMNFVGMVVVGLVIGALGRCFYPGAVPRGWIGTALLGIVGSLVGGFIGSLFSRGKTGLQPAGLVLSVIVAVVAASLGARYWAIILQMAVVELVRVAIMWVICRWRPLSPARIGAARETAVRELQAYWRGFAGTLEPAPTVTGGVVERHRLLDCMELEYSVHRRCIHGPEIVTGSECAVW